MRKVVRNKASMKYGDGCVLSSHNNIQTCIKPNFINENTFFDNKFCNTIKNRFNCDFTPDCLAK